MANNERVDWDEFEDELFELLRSAFHRQECAAKAAARLERVVVDRYIEEQQEPTTATDEDTLNKSVPQASREFNADQFLEFFTSTNILKLVKEFMHSLDLDDLEEEVLSVLIRDSFQFRAAGKHVGRSSGEGELFIGTDSDLALHNMRESAKRAQRIK